MKYRRQIPVPTLVLAVAVVVLELRAVAVVSAQGCTGSGEESCLYDWGVCGTCDSIGAVQGCNQPNTIHLTVDDGPFEWWPTVLDILKWKKVSASFMVVGTQIRGREHIMQRIVADGHTVSTHSCQSLSAPSAVMHCRCRILTC